MATAARTIAKTDNLPKPLITRDELAVDFLHYSKQIGDLESACSEAPSVLEDDEDLAIITGLATSIIALSKKIEVSREEQVRPYIDAQRVVNDFLKAELPTRLAKLKTRLETVATAYQRKKAQREQKKREDEAAEARRLVDEAAAKVTQAVKTGDVQAATEAVTQSNSLTAFANKALAAAAAPVNSMAKVTTDAGSASLVDNWTFSDLDLDKIDLSALRAFFPRAAVEQALRAFIKSGRREIEGARIFNDNKSRFRG